MKLPNVPWKNIAAIGRRSQGISVVRIRPMPPLLQRHARHTFAEILTHQRTRRRASPKGERNLGHHLHCDAGHINGPEYQGTT
ncbi:hypothetical protein [Stenotrophomonas riyadhensis]|jgi:hypothetical protein|nr:hypothetical protein [Stenotrophomonas maltophilia]MBN4961906.1 hypothetical protein [Stenotrophomonas maltophilia]